MPYIHDSERSSFDLDIDSADPLTEGQLNYCITRLIDNWITYQGLSYRNINSAIGVLECAKQELYRRVAAPYEDRKNQENGDVYSSR